LIIIIIQIIIGIIIVIIIVIMMMMMMMMIVTIITIIIISITITICFPAHELGTCGTSLVSMCNSAFKVSADVVSDGDIMCIQLMRALIGQQLT